MKKHMILVALVAAFVSGFAAPFAMAQAPTIPSQPAPSAPAAQTKKQIVALVSTLGDQFNYVRQKQNVGSNIIDNNTRQIIKTPNNALNLAVLRGLERATSETYPGCDHVFISLNPVEMEGVLPQNREAVALGKLVSVFEKMPERQNWDKIVVATPKYLQSEYSGMGSKLQGFGVYVQPLESARLDGPENPFGGTNFDSFNDSETSTPSGKKARSKTYMAPYAYIQVWTLDAKTLQVIDKNARHDFIKLSDPESTALRIENAITPEFLAARMERLIERSVTMAAGGKDPGARIEIGDIKVVTPAEAAKAAAPKK